MSYTQKLAGIVLSLFVCLGYGLSTLAQGGDIELEQYSNAHVERARFAAEDLQILKSSLPKLHIELTSSEWDSRSGLEQQRLVAQSVLPALGVRAKDIDDLLQQLESFDAVVLPRHRNTVDMAMGHVSESLVSRFIHIQREKEYVAVLNDALSRGKDLYPDEVAEATSCLNSSVSRKGKQFILFFEDWIKSLDNLTEEPENESFDVSVVEYSSKFATDLVSHIVAINKDYRSCLGELDSSSGEDKKSELHIGS